MVIKPEIMVGKSKRQQHKDRQHRREESKEELSALVIFISVLELWVVWCEDGVRVCGGACGRILPMRFIPLEYNNF